MPRPWSTPRQRCVVLALRPCSSSFAKVKAATSALPPPPWPSLVTGWGPAETRCYKLPGQWSASSEGSMSNEASHRDESTRLSSGAIRLRHRTEMETPRLSSGRLGSGIWLRLGLGKACLRKQLGWHQSWELGPGEETVFLAEEANAKRPRGTMETGFCKVRTRRRRTG